MMTLNEFLSRLQTDAIVSVCTRKGVGYIIIAPRDKVLTDAPKTILNREVITCDILYADASPALIAVVVDGFEWGVW